MENLKELAIKNGFYNLLFTFFGRLGGFIFTIILARAMLPELFGIYNLAMSTALIFLTFADLGINTVFIKYFSEFYDKNQENIATKYFQYLFSIKLLIAIGVGLILMLLSYPLSFVMYQKPALFIPLLFSSFYLIIFAIEWFFTSVFYAINRPDLLAVKEFFYQLLKILSVIILFSIIPFTYYVTSSFLILSVISLIAIILYLILIQRIIPFVFKKSTYKINKKGIFKFVFWISFANLSAIFFSYIDVVMIGIFIDGPEFVSYYRTAFSLMSGIAGLFFIGSILLPIFTKISDNKLSLAANNVLRLLLIIAFPLSFGLALLSRYFISFIYGPEYLPASLPLFILSFLIIVSVVEGLLLTLFSSREKPKKYALTVSFSMILNVILNVLLITYLLKISDTWAIAGAAIATLTSRIIHVSLLFFFVKQEFKISFKIQSFLKPLIASLAMFFILGEVIKHILDVSLLSGIGIILLGVVIYLGLMFVLQGISKEDFELIKLIRK